MDILIRLLIAHFIGDFLLQPYSWVTHKEKHKLNSYTLYLHVAIHVVLTIFILWDRTLWFIPVIIGISHFVIDAAKVELQKKKNRRLLFFLDQLLHILVIVGIWYALVGKFQILELSQKQWMVILSLIFLSLPASLFIKNIISVYTPKTEMKKNDSLQNAGKYIGILERLLVFTFIVTGHWEGVGFLIAAKSIFRFSDLTEAKDRKLTEYILIGTLLSFGTAILLGILTNLIS